MRLNLAALSACILIFTGCHHPEKADLIVTNAIVYTVDSGFSMAESFAVKGGRFIAVGSAHDILARFSADSVMDAKGKVVFPGFIDSHCHFYGYGKGLQELDLVGTGSFDEVVRRTIEFAGTHPDGWIIGRGWDQNDWPVKNFPDCRILDSLFPGRPVLLERIDGHAALANSEAMRLAKVNVITSVHGGIVEKRNGRLTGIFIDNAVDLVKASIPPASRQLMIRAILDAQKKCFAAGLTTVDDAGLMKQVIDLMDSLQKAGALKMRVYAMLTDSATNLDYYLRHGIYKTDRLNVRSFKFYADGALGSRGACLLKPYNDRPSEQGFLLNTPSYFDSLAAILVNKGFQMNTHCIGDSAVRLIAGIYDKYLKGKDPGSLRWRIEHFQVTTADDLHYLKDGNIIPSVQPTHATSDMYWAADRLGAQRMKYAYAYQQLLKAAGKLALGTDFPVEQIFPVYTFYAAVARKDLKGFPKEGFQKADAISRRDALQGMTTWAAYANFEENEKGSIEAGKFADFIVLDKDIMSCAEQDIPNTNVICTFVAGQCVYKKE